MGVVAVPPDLEVLVEVDEPDGDPLTFALAIKPTGMTINAQGLISWTPTAAQLGQHTVKVSYHTSSGAPI